MLAILNPFVASDDLRPGFGFVHYETEEAAKEAMEKVNGMQIAGRFSTGEQNHWVPSGKLTVCY